MNNVTTSRIRINRRSILSFCAKVIVCFLAVFGLIGQSNAMWVALTAAQRGALVGTLNNILALNPGVPGGGSWSNHYCTPAGGLIAGMAMTPGHAGAIKLTVHPGDQGRAAIDIAANAANVATPVAVAIGGAPGLAAGVAAAVAANNPALVPPVVSAAVACQMRMRNLLHRAAIRLANGTAIATNNAGAFRITPIAALGLPANFLFQCWNPAGAGAIFQGPGQVEVAFGGGIAANIMAGIIPVGAAGFAHAYPL